MNNICLKSSAGSGKTRELTKRFLELFLGGWPLECLYGITFTNKATFEMKERIIRYLDILSERERARPDEEDILRYFKAYRKKASEKRFYLLNNLGDLNISTIDSLFSSFLSSIPFEAGILPDYRIIEPLEERPLINDILDRYLERSTPEDRKILFDLIESERRLIKENLSDVYEKIREDIELIGEGLEDEEGIKKNLDLAEREFRRDAEKFLQFMDENRECAYTLKGTMDRRMEGFINKVGSFVKEKNWEALGQELLMADFLSRAYFKKFIRGLDNINKGGEFKVIAHGLIKGLRDLLGHLSDKELFIHIMPLCEIDRMLDGLKRERNVLTFGDIERLAGRSLKKGVDYLYFKIGANIHHLMIDEFQDTSIGQWEILKPLIDEVTSYGHEKSLFYVGDPNQAIFRWRGGRAELFDFVKTRYSDKIREDALTTNYRSKVEIVEFVNGLFDREDKPLEDHTGGWIRTLDMGSFKHRAEGDESTISKTVDTIKELRRLGYGYHDIAILVRDNRYGLEVADALGRESIPCISESKACILARYDTRTMINLLKFLEGPEDDLSLAQVLLSPYFRIDESTLIKIKERDKSLYMTLTDKYPHWNATKRLKDFLSMIGFSNPYELLGRIYEGLNLPISSSLAALLEAALSFTKEGYNPLSSFIEWIEEVGEGIEVNGSEQEGVKVLTVHKAKGLDFNVVILPNTVWTVRPENSKILYSYKKGEIIPQRIYWRRIGKNFREIIQEEEERLINDAKNLLYVALTRAREGLIILGYDARGFNWWNFIKERGFGNYSLGTKDRTVEKEGLKKDVPQKVVRFESPPRIEKSARALYFPSEEEVAFTPYARRELIEWGTILHKALSHVEWLEGKGLENPVREIASKTAGEFGGSPEEVRDIAGMLESVLIKVLSSPDLTFIFHHGNRDVILRREVPIYFTDGDHDVSGRIDRLIIEKNRITILDFKTGEEKKGDKGQIRLYEKGIMKIFPDKEVESYLLYIGDEGGKAFLLRRV